MSIENKNLVFQSFFDELTECIFDANFELMPSFYAEPWIFVRGDNHYVIDRNVEMNKKFSKAVALLIEKGVERWDLHFKKIISINEQDYFVTLTWNLKDANHQQVLSFTHSYLVKLRHDLPQIITVVSDGELDFYSGI